MKILWLTAQFPCLRSGGQVRQFHLLRHLSRRHQLTVVSLLQPAEREAVTALAALGINVVVARFQPGRTGNRRLRSWLRFLFDARPHLAHVYPVARLTPLLAEVLPVFQPDLIHLEELFTAELQKLLERYPLVLGTQNVESVNLARQHQQITTSGRRLTSWLDLQKLKRYERMALRRSTACVAVSEADAALLHRLVPHTPVTVVPNGVDVPAFAPPAGEAHREGMLFLGTLDYEPNRQGLLTFCREILPLIRARRPRATLTIIGANAPSAIETIAELPGIHYRGFVPDVRPYLWQAAVCVVPLFAGGGTRLKILEALAAGCPVVSTPLGAEGLALRPERELLLAEDAPGFAQQVLRLLAEPALAQRLARAGRERVQRYDWEQIAPRLERVYQDTLRGKQPVTAAAPGAGSQ